MTPINHDLRRKILDALSTDHLTARQIAGRMTYATEAGVYSALRAMRVGGLVRYDRVSGAWRAA